MKSKNAICSILFILFILLSSCDTLDKSLYPWKYVGPDYAKKIDPNQVIEKKPQELKKNPLVNIPPIVVKEPKLSKKEKEFLNYKNAGIKAFGQNKLTEAIDQFSKALFMKPDDEIIRYLNACYYERGEYYFKLGDYNKAMQDLAMSDTKESYELQITISKKNKIKLLYPENKSLQRLDMIKFRWESVFLADYYIIQIENADWKTIVSKKVDQPEWTSLNELTMNSVYYWSVRAHYPNNTWGDWSPKWWFSLRTIQFEIDQYKASCEVYPYVELLTNPDRLKGKNLVVTGQVKQIRLIRGETSYLLINITKEGGIYKDTIYVQYMKETLEDKEIKEGNLITVWGGYQGLISYQTMLGDNMTIPCINARYISLQEKGG